MTPMTKNETQEQRSQIAIYLEEIISELGLIQKLDRNWLLSQIDIRFAWWLQLVHEIDLVAR